MGAQVNAYLEVGTSVPPIRSGRSAPRGTETAGITARLRGRRRDLSISAIEKWGPIKNTSLPVG